MDTVILQQTVITDCTANTLTTMTPELDPRAMYKVGACSSCQFNQLPTHLGFESQDACVQACGIKAPCMPWTTAKDSTMVDKAKLLCCSTLECKRTSWCFLLLASTSLHPLGLVHTNIDVVTSQTIFLGMRPFYTYLWKLSNTPVIYIFLSVSNRVYIYTHGNKRRNIFSS